MRFLRALTLFLRRSSWRPAPEWTGADARALATYFGSPSGLKLLEILRQEVAGANERAAMKAAPFDCGWACGYRALFAWLQSLSTPTAEEANDETSSSLDYFHP